MKKKRNKKTADSFCTEIQANTFIAMVNDGLPSWKEERW